MSNLSRVRDKKPWLPYSPIEVFVRPRPTGVSWLLEEAIAFCRRVEPVLAAHGWHCSLGGGVLQKGYSCKDLDLVCYPHSTKRARLRNLDAALESLGLVKWKDVTRVRKGSLWRESADRKHVEIWYLGAHRIDVIALRE